MKWLTAFVSGQLLVIVLLFLLSDFLDPYGLKETQNKRVENLNSEEAFLYPLKIQPNSYYLVGTSRTLAFDIKTIEKNLKRKTYFLGISGSNINQWLFLVQKIKERKSNIILGLDLFSLNQTQIKENTKSQILLDQTFKDFNFFTKYFYFLNSNFIQTSFSTIFKNFFVPKNHLFNTQNLNNSQNNFKIKENPYKNFRLAQNQFHKLLSYLSPQDIVIVFPEYWKYYTFYLRHSSFDCQNLLEEYIQTIKILAMQTQAQIWIFGGINSITLEDKNFDYDYWHFKPKIAELIVKRIFKQQIDIQDFGFEINRKNLDEQLQEWKDKIISHENKVEK